MKSQVLLALILVTVALGRAAIVHAQGLPPMYGPPVYAVPERAYGAIPPGYIPNAPLPDGEALLPQEVIGILRSAGFAPLAIPVRRGPYYEVAAFRPDGEQGRVTMDALTGRFVRFVPTDRPGGMEAGLPMAPFRSPLPSAAGRLRPPAPVPPNGTSRSTGAPPLPQPRPDAASSATASNAGAQKPGSDRVAENKGSDSKVAADAPAEVKPTFAAPAGPKLLPTPAMPPVQTLE